MGKAELFTKIIGKSVDKLNKINTLNFIEIPKGAVTFDIVRGTGKKGNFTIWSFKGEFGELLSRQAKYTKDGNITNIRRKYNVHSDGSISINQYKEVNDYSDLEITSRRFFFDDTRKSKDIWMFDRNVRDFNDEYDTLKIGYLSRGSKPQSLEFSTFWDGKKPQNITVNSQNKKKLPQKNLEYLPLIGNQSDGNKQVVKHISKIQEKKFGLEGLLPKVKIFDSLKHPDRSGGCDIARDCQISVANDILYNNYKLLGTMGHEYQHASDVSNIWRLESILQKCTPEEIRLMEKESPKNLEFVKKCQQKGIIPNSSKLGKKITNIDKRFDWMGEQPYYSRLQEQRAITAGANEQNKLKALAETLKNIFNAEFSPLYCCTY